MSAVSNLRRSATFLRGREALTARERHMIADRLEAAAARIFGGD